MIPGVCDGIRAVATSNAPIVLNETRATPGSRRFWLSHALWPAAAFIAAFALIATFDLDRRISHAWFYDANHDLWIGEGGGAWWAKDLLHSAGRWIVRLFALAALVTWIATFGSGRLRNLRRPAAFAFLGIALSTGLVGGLKVLTDVDCPWDLAEFGGDRPYVELFANRPDELPRAKCFPGAHASSGFALIFGYFLLRDTSRRRARWALAAGLLAGLSFSLGQEARGAHFISHDMTSAAIVWFVQLSLYWLLGLRSPARERSAGRGFRRRLTGHEPEITATASRPMWRRVCCSSGLLHGGRIGARGTHTGAAEREFPQP